MADESIIGLPELSKNLQRMAKMIDEPIVENGLVRIGHELSNRLDEAAPLGKTGHLKKAFKSKKFKHNKIKGAPATFVAVDYRVGQHYHLVEYGHKGPKPDSKPTPAHPFGRRTVSGFAPGYEGKVANMLRGVFDSNVLPEHRYSNPLSPTFLQTAGIDVGTHGATPRGGSPTFQSIAESM